MTAPIDPSRTEDRNRMVHEQIERRGVTDPAVLRAMRSVARHRFVPREVEPAAYEDEPLPIGFGQTISQPYIVAFMTEALALTGREKVLEIGTGSGYQAAILAETARSVYTIEILAPLAERATKLLSELGYANVHVRCADGFMGWPEAAPFDRILLTAAPLEIPPALIDQLKQGGRLVAPVGDVWQELVLVIKGKGTLERKSLLPVRFVPMTGAAEKQRR
jgi:protein-L-isoaspartate(D-aspartate) O-methyltransferase